MSGLDRLPRRPMRSQAGAELDVIHAEGLRSRMVGLLGASGLPERTALLIPRCDSVHTVGMRFALDVVFVRRPDPAGPLEIVAVHPDVRPGRFARVRRRGTGMRRRELCALELATGQAAALGLEPGMLLEQVAEPTA